MPDDDLAAPDPRPVPRIPGSFRAAIAPPGSKSLTNRHYLLAALGGGTRRLARPLRSDDCDRMRVALATLGAASRIEGDDVVMTGVAGRFPRGGRVDLGDGGTPTRFMIAAACLAAEPVTVDGSPRMRERPVAEGVAMLRALGARIDWVEAEGRLPVRVEPGGTFHGGAIEVGRTASSQFISAILLVAPWLRDGVRVRFLEPPTSAPYLEQTVAALRAVGADVRREARGGAADDVVVAPAPAAGADVAIAPDASSAAYWHVAAALRPGAEIVLPGLPDPATQPDAAVPLALEAAGAEIRRDAAGRSTMTIGGATLAPFEDLDCAGFPDGALALAAAAARATGPSRLRGLRTLRVKESDRVAALATELRRVGCRVRATDDALEIDPAGAHDDPVSIATYRDHRIAMAFAVLGLARGGIAIEDPGCVVKSYPGFWRDLGAVVRAAGGPAGEAG